MPQPLEAIRTNQTGQRVLDGFQAVAVAGNFEEVDIEAYVAEAAATEAALNDPDELDTDTLAGIGRRVLQLHRHNQTAPDRFQASNDLSELMDELTGRTVTICTLDGKQDIHVFEKRWSDNSNQTINRVVARVATTSAMITPVSYDYFQLDRYGLTFDLPKRFARHRQYLGIQPVDRSGNPLISLRID